MLKTGSKKQKSWKRMVSKATFVGEGFTRKPVKMERFIRPMALRYKKANVTHRGWSRVQWIAIGHLTRASTLLCSRPQGDLPAAHYRRQEEPPVAAVHPARRAHQGHGRRGQRERARSRHHRRQGCLGECVVQGASRHAKHARADRITSPLQSTRRSPTTQRTTDASTPSFVSVAAVRAFQPRR